MTSDLFPTKAPRVFRFVWIGRTGPVLKTFLSVETFSGYVREVRTLLGEDSIEFRTPTLCFGVLK